MANQQLFIGRLPLGTSSKDLDRVFHKYGPMSRCDVKQGMKMAYGFIEYEDQRDAEEAIECEQGTEIQGARIVVEWSRGYKDKGERGGGGRSYDRSRDRGDRDYDRDRYSRSSHRSSHGDKGSYRGHSPDYHRGRSPDYHKGRSPDYHKGRSPDNHKGRSPDNHRSYDRSSDNYYRSSHRSRSRSRDRY